MFQKSIVRPIFTKGIFKRFYNTITPKKEKPFEEQLESHRKIMTQALKLAKHTHSLYDKNEQENEKLSKSGKTRTKSESFYHKEFVNGINTHFKQTNNCLIIVDPSVSILHTPLGKWSICGSILNFPVQNTDGSYSSSNDIMKNEIHKRIRCELLCPGYYTDFSFNEKRWLVKSVHGVNVNCPRFDYWPTEEKPYDSTDKKNALKFKVHSDKLREFYKKPDEYPDREISQKIFGELLAEWIRKEYISDINKNSRDMLDSDEEFDRKKDYFLEMIDPMHRPFVFHEQFSTIHTKAHAIFRMIYMSKTNDNSYDHISV